MIQVSFSVNESDCKCLQCRMLDTVSHGSSRLVGVLCAVLTSSSLSLDAGHTGDAPSNSSEQALATPFSSPSSSSQGPSATTDGSDSVVSKDSVLSSSSPAPSVSVIVHSSPSPASDAHSASSTPAPMSVTSSTSVESGSTSSVPAQHSDALELVTEGCEDSGSLAEEDDAVICDALDDATVEATALDSGALFSVVGTEDELEIELDTSSLLDVDAGVLVACSAVEEAELVATTLD